VRHLSSDAYSGEHVLLNKRDCYLNRLPGPYGSGGMHANSFSVAWQLLRASQTCYCSISWGRKPLGGDYRIGTPAKI